MPSLPARFSDRLGQVTWLVVLAAGLAAAATPRPAGGSAGRLALGVATVVSTAVLLTRLGVAAVAWPQRRVATTLLGVALSLWSAGSWVLTASDRPGQEAFPGPGGGLFLVAYALMAGFLLFDSAGLGRARLATAVEGVITGGGVICLAGAIMITPVAGRLREQGTDAVATLVYPVLDLVLFAWVLADLLLLRRARSRESVLLLAGFAAMAAADTLYSWQLTRGSYQSGSSLIVGWVAGLTCLVGGACGARVPASEPDRHPGVVSPFVAGVVAVLVLAAAPSDIRSAFLVVPCVATLLATGARLTLALREARGAAEAYRLSLTDDLTELPNRRALLARLQADAGPDAITLLLLDLDGFKEVNDTLGHVHGDRVLQQLAGRLRTSLGDALLVARLGGDEFAVLMAGTDDGTATRAADTVLALVAQPFQIDQHSLTMAASVGVAISRRPGSRSDLLRQADVAMYQAKANRTGSRIYDPDLDEFTTDRLKTVEYLRLGIPAGQLRMWYQPQVRGIGRQVTGVEALVRWEHPELGLLAPDAFLPIARQAGLMPLLTETVVAMVLADARRWRQDGARLQFAFNVAPPELLNTALLDRVLARIDVAGLPGGSLVLEITEDSLLADPERARRSLLQIQQHQVEVSIDDYGTGFSSLSYLRDLPVHELKLDRSFISTVDTDPRSRIIIASTCQMATGLGLRTVAEGVEDLSMAEAVRELGVDLLQGYFIARPMPADDLLGWLNRWNDAPADAWHGPEHRVASRP